MGNYTMQSFSKFLNVIFSPFNIIRVLVGAVLYWAIWKHDYSYYIMLRWIVFSLSVYTIWKSFKININFWLWVYVIVALLFNPFFPFHLDKSFWVYIDLIVGSTILTSIAFIPAKNNRV
jgi:hypothetical protein